VGVAGLNLRNILLRLEYRGTDFSGWQIQAKGRTVQGVLAENLSRFLREDIIPLGSGRTDSGVHALAQYAGFRTSNAMKTSEIRHRLSRMLPDDVIVTGCREVPPGFNVRRDATARSYRYLISEKLSALNHGFSWVIARRLDIGFLGSLAGITKKSKAFGNFCKVKSRKADNRCRIIASRWIRHGGFLKYEITADRFLHNMVRLLVGTMVAVADGKMSIGDFRRLFNPRIDSKAKYIAPARGLYLVGVQYKGIKL
jgi:tRNA pseudouridine38-40 synthase